MSVLWMGVFEKKKNVIVHGVLNIVHGIFGKILIVYRVSYSLAYPLCFSFQKTPNQSPYNVIIIIIKKKYYTIPWVWLYFSKFGNLLTWDCLYACRGSNSSMEDNAWNPSLLLKTQSQSNIGYDNYLGKGNKVISIIFHINILIIQQCIILLYLINGTWKTSAGC